MKIFGDTIFQKNLENNLEKMPFESKVDFSRIMEIFPLKKINIIGGFVRDSILQVLIDYDFPVNDLDVLVEDLEFENKTKEFSQKNRSRFGGLKFEYDNFSIDFFGLENIFYLKDNPNLEKNLENVLKGCDLTTSAIGYNLEENKFYSLGAIEDIYKKTININTHKYLKVAPTISRLILHADKLGFELSKNSLNYIKKNYSPEIDNEINDFLSYKKIGYLFEQVKDRIEDIVR